ncbi:DUF1523 family protein [Cereibacter sphaeroides]|uniref:DUF1523 family protein n=1 Tax=Rhodobacterales TaxID=204455 RepID=UPI000BBEFE5F|nr:MULTISPECIES: DUF1523 family protein [Paracoccaceae]MCE6950453.1 DUF1523 family protein [Cereibacter sphaeroides]MCE6959514.1 DUF1523 family protein [Cereibacter sphaeroides]MCE6968213.1 DUF1523 family protein [Cereibacter sphaeroides]MCE6973715.1 DUF1523 family protein [Cereibacter sphaeroides]
MRYAKWTALALVALLIAAFLHYTLPQHDIVRIVGTNTQRMDLGENSFFFAAPDAGTNVANAGSRDVKFIQAVFPNGKTMVYRNEDTGWGWPPYFKVNSFDVQAKATDLTSTSGTPQWVSITHYGWRNQLFTIFPNALNLKPVAGPDTTIIPWFNILFFLTLGLIAFMIYKMWMQFRERTIDPALEDIEDAWDSQTQRARKQARTSAGRFRAWLNSLRN